MRYLIFFFSLLLSTQYLLAQTGGRYTYSFLNLPVSARQAALGGNLLSVQDADMNLAYLNPALLNNQMNKHLSLSYINYFSDINFGYAGYAFNAKKRGTMSTGLQCISYGDFQRADETGLVTGEFSAADYTFHFSGSRPVKDSLFNVGAAFKVIYSSLESYQSLGVAADVAGFYYNEELQLGVGAVIKNIGTQLITYRAGNREPLPFEIQAGVSKRLAKAPLRLSLTYENLERFRLVQKDTVAPVFNPLTGEEENTANTGAFDQVMRHLVWSAELFPAKNFFIRIGYNYQRRQELKLLTRTGTAGLSWGFGLRIAKFHLSYGRAVYHLAGPSNHFTIGTSLSAFGASN